MVCPEQFPQRCSGLQNKSLLGATETPLPFGGGFRPILAPVRKSWGQGFFFIYRGQRNAVGDYQEWEALAAQSLRSSSDIHYELTCPRDANAILDDETFHPMSS